MGKLIFTLEHASETNGYGTDEVRYSLSIEEANEIFNEWFEKQPVAHGKLVYGFATDFSAIKTPLGIKQSTHTARLVCIEEIKPKAECEHEIITKFVQEHIGMLSTEYYCKKCKVKLKPTGWVAE